MTAQLPIIDMPSVSDFVEHHIAANQPVVVRGLDVDTDRWTPEAIAADLGDLTALVYGSLFDLEDIQTLQEYLEDWFGLGDDLDLGSDEDEVPYVRWYNKLRDVEFAWGDEAFARVADRWRPPACLPRDRYVVPVGDRVDPTVDHFPYRGLLVAARGARTRLHRDPFFSDAVVCMFHGVKDAVLYHPSRTAELTVPADEAAGDTSFGGFVDVRPDPLAPPIIEPDLQGSVGPGDMLYVPNGWLHDVVAVDDSLSITWNFVHSAGARKFESYLAGSPEADSEFEILRYCHQMAGRPAGLSAADMMAG